MKQGKLTTEFGGSNTLQLVIPYGHHLWSSFKKLTSIVEVYRDDDLLFYGRLLDETTSFNRDKTLYCEDYINVLYDSVLRPYTYTGSLNGYIEMILTSHNEQVDENKKIYLGNVTVTDDNDYIVRSSQEAAKTYEELTDKLEDFGGYIQLRHENDINYLDFLADYETDCTQCIQFGKNLLDISQYINAKDVITVLVPYGAVIEQTEADSTEDETTEEGVTEVTETAQERITIKDVNGGLDYIENTTAISLYGRVVGTNTWDDVTLPENLLTKARNYLNKNIFMSTQLTLSAIDLNYINVDFQAIKAGMNVRCISVPHNVDDYFQCSKVEYDLLEPQNNVYTLGIIYKRLSEKALDNAKNINATNANITHIETNVINEANNIVKTYREEVSVNLDDINTSVQLVNEKIVDLRVLVENTAKALGMLVTGENGESLVIQTEDGWTFSTSNISDAVNSISGSLQNYLDKTETVEEAVDALKIAMNDLEGKAEYISVTTYTDDEGNVEPCLLLGETDSEFKLMITNTKIMFMYEGLVPTRINTYGLVTENIEVENELKLGNFVWEEHGNGNVGLIWKEE